jgi:hypothetical protein
MQIIRTDTPINLTIPSREPTTGQVVLTGIQFDGISTYMDLGIVPLLNSADSYVKMKFKATNWAYKMPFGFSNPSSDKFYFYLPPTNDRYVLQSSVETTVIPSQYPTSDSYQEMEIAVSAVNELSVTVAGNDVLLDTPFTNRSESGIGFYLGALNITGTAANFAEVVFTEIEFYNGVTTKIFNAANDWNGATNYGGVEVYSIDGGTTWTETHPTQEEIDKINVFNINIITENESDRTEFIETVEATYSNGQLSFEMEFTPIESTFYFSRVRNESANRELLKFKSFCTNQTDLQDYTTSEGVYITPPQSDNDFIVIQ